MGRIGTTLEYGILEHQHLAQNRIALEYIGIGIGQQARCNRSPLSQHFPDWSLKRQRRNKDSLFKSSCNIVCTQLFTHRSDLFCRAFCVGCRK